MDEFKEGDLIKRIKGHNNSSKGMTSGTVYKVIGHYSANVRVADTNTGAEIGNSSGWDPDNFELVESEIETYNILNHE